MERNAGRLPIPFLVRQSAGLLLGLAALAFIVHAFLRAPAELATVNWRIDPVPLGVAFLVYSVGLLLAVQNWGSILAMLGRPAPFQENLRIYCSTNILKRLPGVLWHVVGRAALYQQHGIPARVTALASTLELVLNGLAGGCLYLGLVLAGVMTDAPAVLPVAIITLTGFAVLHPRLANPLLARVLPTTGALQLRDLACWLMVNGGVVVLGGSVLFLALRSVLAVPLAGLPLAIGAWGLAVVASNVFFFVPGGIGIREGALVAALAPLAPAPALAVLAIAFRLWSMACEIVWALAAGVLLPLATKPWRLRAIGGRLAAALIRLTTTGRLM